MPEYDDTNTGMLYRDPNPKTERHPGYRGFLNCRCPLCDQASDFWVSAWVRQAKKDGKMLRAGQSFFSLSVQPKQKPKDTPRAPLASTLVAVPELPTTQKPAALPP